METVLIPKRGEIYWVALNPTLGSEVRKTRPCVIMSATALNRARRTVVVVPISSSTNVNPPITVSVRCAGKQAVAVCDQIRAVDKARLRDKLGELTHSEMDNIGANLRSVLWL